MSLKSRLVLAAVAAALAASPATAQAAGTPNNDNAKACQKGGHEALRTQTGGTFANQGECVRYAAAGGSFLQFPVGRAACEDAGGVFTLISSDPIHWTCAGVPPQALLQACGTDLFAFGDGDEFNAVFVQDAAVHCLDI